PVVVVPVEDDVAGGFATREVALGADSVALRQADVADAGVGRDDITYGVGSVINDDELPVGVVLAEEVPERVRKEGTAVVGRKDAGGNRWRHYSRSPRYPFRASVVNPDSQPLLPERPPTFTIGVFVPRHSARLGPYSI